MCMYILYCLSHIATVQYVVSMVPGRPGECSLVSVQRLASRNWSGTYPALASLQSSVLSVLERERASVTAAFI